jgi:hypothetical protein
MDDIQFTYLFKFSKGPQKKFTVTLASEDLSLQMPEPKKRPDWVALDHCQCSNCPLKKEETPDCPVASNLAAIAMQFDRHLSTEKVEVTVVAPERTYQKKLSLQEGLQGLFGLVMATSACPHMTYLRPMARFHLPFSSMHESLVRSVGFYLTRQYFEASKGGKADFTLERLKELSENLHIVNAALVKRVRNIAKKDAGLNSIIWLDVIAQTLPLEIGNQMDDVEAFFPPLPK